MYVWIDSVFGVCCVIRIWWLFFEFIVIMVYVWVFCWIFCIFLWCYLSVYKCEIFESIVFLWIILIFEFLVLLNLRYED